jgi:hypothetical protein
VTTVGQTESITQTVIHQQYKETKASKTGLRQAHIDCGSALVKFDAIVLAGAGGPGCSRRASESRADASCPIAAAAAAVPTAFASTAPASTGPEAAVTARMAWVPSGCALLAVSPGRSGAAAAARPSNSEKSL